MRAYAFSGLLVAAVLGIGFGAQGGAGSPSGGARTLADESCVMKCDKQSDKCMADAGHDEKKAKACDDQYAACLSKCR